MRVLYPVLCALSHRGKPGTSLAFVPRLREGAVNKIIGGRESGRRRARGATESARACSVRVTDIMAEDVVCLDPDMAAADACELLLEHGLDAGVATDQEDHAVGLVLLRDLLQGAREAEAGEAWSEPSPERLFAQTEVGISYPLEAGYQLERPVRRRVAELMRPAAFCLPEHSSVARAAALMELSKISHAVITHVDGTVAGTVSSNDIARWLATESGYLGPSARSGAPRRPVVTRRRPFPFPKAHRRTILVVEDDSEICDTLVELFQDEGFVALRASDGRQALDTLGALDAQPGLIVLDLMMPRMNGWQFRAAQLESERLRSIPVVVLTAHGASLGPSDELHSPAAVLAKPIGVDALMDVVLEHYQRFN